MTRRTPAQYDWSKLLFDETLLTKHYTSMRTFEKRYVVVHHMTIIGDGKGKALDGCWNTWQKREASAHYGVDGDLVRQYVYDKDYAWSTGNTRGNLYGISIEHANASGKPDWRVADDTWRTGARLVAQIHVAYKFGRPVAGETLFQHSDFFATECAGPYLGKKIWAEYVAEAQRVYDEITGTAPKPTPKPKPKPKGKDACFRVGYGNLQMGYRYTKTWTPAQEKASADYMRKMGCSVYGIVEAHEENGMVDNWFKHWPSNFRLAKGSTTADGNVAVYDANKHRLISHSTIDLGPKSSPRRATRLNFEHIATGVRWWLVVTHLTAGNALTRAAQSKRLFAGVDSLHRVVMAADLNNYAAYTGSPMSQAKANDWTDASRIAKSQVDMDRWGSHHGSPAGKNIDHLLVRTRLDLVTVDRLQMHPTGGGYGWLSDHNWLSATVTITHPHNA